MVNVRQVDYAVGEDRLRATMAVPDGDGPFPGVLIGHEGPGLDEVQRARAADIARLGYVGMALDYHGQHAPFTDRDLMMRRLDHLSENPDECRALGAAALEVLVAEPSVDVRRIAAIGYCYGATIALELARSGAALTAVVGFHPGLRTIRPHDARHIVGRVLMFVGADDPLIPPEHRLEFEQEMRAGGVDWRLVLYGGVQHSFTHPLASQAGLPGIRYDERAAEDSWREMSQLLTDVFSSPH
ncbi:MAG: dienelactone hydrolase family protein [Ilumatobacteraceae bacterium]